jgi:hypothetical protein
MESWCPPPPAHGTNPHPSNDGPGHYVGDTGYSDTCYNWLPGCPGFTGGGAGQSGEQRIGPGYYRLTGTSPTRTTRAVRTAARAAGETCSGAGLRFGTEPGCHVAPTPTDKGAFNAVRWLTQTAVPWIIRNRVSIVGYGALAACLIPAVGIVGCAVGAGIAFSVRSQARIERYGFKASLAANSADLLTTVVGVGIGGALEEGTGEIAEQTEPFFASGVKEMSGGTKFLVGVAASQGDIVSTIGGYIPHVNPIYFNSQP